MIQIGLTNPMISFMHTQNEKKEMDRAWMS